MKIALTFFLQAVLIVSALASVSRIRDELSTLGKTVAGLSASLDKLKSPGASYPAALAVLSEIEQISLVIDQATAETKNTSSISIADAILIIDDVRSLDGSWTSTLDKLKDKKPAFAKLSLSSSVANDLTTVQDVNEEFESALLRIVPVYLQPWVSTEFDRLNFELGLAIAVYEESMQSSSFRGAQRVYTSN